MKLPWTRRHEERPAHDVDADCAALAERQRQLAIALAQWEARAQAVRLVRAAQRREEHRWT